jgi:hypothetical protein
MSVGNRFREQSATVPAKLLPNLGTSGPGWSWPPQRADDSGQRAVSGGVIPRDRQPYLRVKVFTSAT